MDIQLMEARPPYVRFEYRAVEDRQASIEKGHYVSKNIAIAFITPAGTKDITERDAEDWLNNLTNLSHQGQVNPQWPVHFRNMYDQWKRGEELPESGTAIKGWAVISPADQQNIIAANIRTVEDLAEASEQAMTHIGMGARMLKEKAKKWLESAHDNGKVVQKVTALEAENADLKRTLSEMMERMAALEADKPRRGRPPKDEAVNL